MSEKLKFILINGLDDEYIDTNIYFNSKNARSAAMKAWRCHKYLNEIWIQQLDTLEIFRFNATDWMYIDSKGQRKFKSI